jgi:hypothetical protein
MALFDRMADYRNRIAIQLDPSDAAHRDGPGHGSEGFELGVAIRSLPALHTSSLILAHVVTESMLFRHCSLIAGIEKVTMACKSRVFVLVLGLSLPRYSYLKVNKMASTSTISLSTRR